MKLLIAGKDRSGDIGASIVRRAAELEGPLSEWEPEESALSLKHSTDSSDYFDRFCRLMRLRRDVGPTFHPMTDGAKAGAVRSEGVLSKLFGRSHNTARFQQNVINELMVSAFDFQQSALWQKIADLEKKVERLETELHSSRTSDSSHAAGKK